MKRLSTTQSYIMIGMISFGAIFIVADLFSPIFFTVGYTAIIMGTLLMFLECGPSFWYWWVPFGLGTRYDVDTVIYDRKYDEIMRWMKENFGDSIRYYNHGNVFYFTRKTDAMAFKLAWEE